MDPGGAVRGSCPSVHRPFAAADGGLARIRVPGGALTAEQASTVAGVARRHGSGVIEITSRANLQLRGVPEGAQIGAELAAAGLLPPSPTAEDRTNVMASPTAGFDPAELLDVTWVVHEIVRRVADADLEGVSPKFGVLVDGGGEVGLRGRTADVGLVAAGVASGRARTQLRFALVLAEPVPQHPPPAGELVLVPPELAAGAVLAAMRLGASWGRMGDLVEQLGRRQVLDRLEAGVGARFEWVAGPDVLRWPELRPRRPLGVRPERRRDCVYVDAAPPLGRLDGDALAGLAALASSHGDGRLRLTPWRTVLLPGVPRASAAGVGARLAELGLSCDPADPVGSVVACAGSRGCTAGLADTQADGLRLLQLLREAGGSSGTVHLSGCAKGCAGVRAGDVTLVGTGGGYAVFVRSEGAPGFGSCVAEDLEPEAALRSALELTR